jgi:hypothetical protein
MTKREKEKVNTLRRKYPDLCKGKSEKTLLAYARFIEEVRKQVKSHEMELDSKWRFSYAASEWLGDKIISALK